jgi:hypothetical protein
MKKMMIVLVALASASAFAAPAGHNLKAGHHVTTASMKHKKKTKMKAAKKNVEEKQITKKDEGTNEATPPAEAPAEAPKAE